MQDFEDVRGLRNGKQCCFAQRQGTSRWLLSMTRALPLSPLVLLVCVPAAFASTCGDGNAPVGGACTMQPFNPATNDSQVGATVVNGGDTVTLGGTFSFALGEGGSAGRDPVQDFTIISGGSNLSDPVLDLGPQNQTATYVDPVTGAVRTVNVYGSAGMSTAALGTKEVPNIVGVGDQQYIDTRIATVESTGGKLNVDVDGNIKIAAKQTTLVKADGTGSAASEVVWSSSNSIDFFGVAMPANAQNSFTSTQVPGWPTTVTLPNGSVVTINNLSDFQAFNNQLVTLVQNGTIGQAEYNSLIAQGANLQTATVVYQYNPVPPPGDDIYQPEGLRTVIEATGVHASATLAAGATLTVSQANGGVLRGTNGGTVTNKGTINIVGGGGMVLETGAKGSNEGVINSRTGSNGVVTTLSTFTNSGIINQREAATADAAGFSGGIAINSILSDTKNTGIINVGTVASTANASATGVRVLGGSFTNAAGGVIYIGREEQTDKAVPSADVALNLGGQVSGINVLSDSTVINAGQIVIGSQTQGAVGLRVDSASNVNVTNSGTILVKGAADGVPRENVGFLVRNTGTDTGSTLRNTGAITVAGVNGTGLKVLADGANANVASTGSITVAGGADPASGTRNYGVWVEGSNGGEAKAKLDGPLILTGNGAIGALARGNAEITVGAGASPVFAAGSDQIGFFIFGNGASISTVDSTLQVGTQRSTLFRIAEGATFDGSKFTIVASGTDSVGIVATGAGTKVSDNGGTFYLTGARATGVVVEGGAEATLDTSTTLYLNATGTVGGVVDGIKHDLTGAPVGAPDPATKLKVTGTVASNTANVTGFVAKNGATLDVRGQTSLAGAGSTGIRAQSGAKVFGTFAEIGVNGTALTAGKGISSFAFNQSEIYGSDLLFSTVAGASTKLLAIDSTLEGGIFTAAGSTSSVTLTGGSVWLMDKSSNVTNLAVNGSTVVFGSPANGFKTLTVDNDYTGTGAAVAMNTTLNNGAVQLTDKIVVTGDTAGSTTLFISNAGGKGAKTVGNGIKVVDVEGASDGSFALGNSLVVGAYEYDLFKGGISSPNDGDWYLRSSLTPPAQVATPYLDTLSNFQQATVGTLQQRLGNRQWPAGGTAPTGTPGSTPGSGSSNGGFWGRMVGLHNNEQPDQGTPYDSDLWFAQVGLDGVLYQNKSGVLVAGILGTYGNQSVNVHVTPDPTTRLQRSGSISTDGYGIGGTLTWFGNDGLYVDGVGQYTWFSSDLSASGMFPAVKGNNGEAYALSLEAGKRFALNRVWALVPQAQLVYSSATFDDFFVTYAGGNGALVTAGDGDSLTGRVGVRLENLLKLGGNSRFQGYGIANVVYDFLGGTDMTFAGTQLIQDGQPLWGELGLGFTYVMNRSFSFYGEGSYATALEAVGDSYVYRGNLGMRFSW